jgi:hypothetical protein
MDPYRPSAAEASVGARARLKQFWSGLPCSVAEHERSALSARLPTPPPPNLLQPLIYSLAAGLVPQSCHDPAVELRSRLRLDSSACIAASSRDPDGLRVPESPSLVFRALLSVNRMCGAIGVRHSSQAVPVELLGVRGPGRSSGSTAIRPTGTGYAWIADAYEPEVPQRVESSSARTAPARPWSRSRGPSSRNVVPRSGV